jgi:hypothetical protein
MVNDGSTGIEDVSTNDNPAALMGTSAYAMWPIIEDQTDVIPNSGDFAKLVGTLNS